MRTAAQYLLILQVFFLTEASTENERRQTAETRIVGGTESALNSRPYYVQWPHGCGGVLFHDDLVLTAAHCNAAEHSFFVGGNGTSGSGTLLMASAAYPHPLCEENRVHAYDFMVLKLPQRFQTIPFATINADPNHPTEGTPLTVVGHGRVNETDGNENFPTLLRQVTVPYIQDCGPFYEGIQSEVQFCAGDMPQGGKDACQGDSGSGIFDSNGLLIGLVSWGIGCARPKLPGVYARVSKVERWLEHLKCQASDYPPAHCTPIQVNFTLDAYPEELGLTLLDAEPVTRQSEILVRPPGSFSATLAGQSLQFNWSVPRGRDYILRVKDTNRDGFCCGTFGNGSLTVADGPIHYPLDGNFSTKFTSLLLPMVGGLDPPPPANSTGGRPSAPTSSIKVLILYGTTGADAVGWKLYNQTRGKRTLIHQDDPRNPQRQLDEFRRQSVVFTDLTPGTYQISAADGRASRPGLIQLQIFSLDGRGTALRLLLQLRGGEAFVVDSFQVGSTLT